MKLHVLFAMPLLNPLSTEQCNQQCSKRELGPAIVLLDEYCAEGTSETICIPCLDQRSDLSVQWNQTFTDIPNQCSSRTGKRRSGTEMMMDVSLGAGVARPELIAAIFDTEVTTDPTDGSCQVINIRDNAGRCPSHFQVTVIPYDGSELDFSFGLIFDYAITYTQNTTHVFSPTTPIEMTLSFFGEPHPVTGRIGSFLYGVNGEDCALLKTLVPADCLPTAA